jgi:hypothetical protein
MPVYMHHYVYVHITESQRSVSQRLRGAIQLHSPPLKRKNEIATSQSQPKCFLQIPFSALPLLYTPCHFHKIKQSKKKKFYVDGMEWN